MNLMVTGFGPFGEFESNPSEALASQSGMPFEILEVSFRAVDSFIGRIKTSPPECLLCIGLAAKAERFRFETIAHNKIGPGADVRGEMWGPGPIDPAGPPMHSGSLWEPIMLHESSMSEASMDAGGYLCNYLYFQALRQLPTANVGFLHVPPFEKIDRTTQALVLTELIHSITQRKEPLVGSTVP